MRGRDSRPVPDCDVGDSVGIVYCLINQSSRGRSPDRFSRSPHQVAFSSRQVSMVRAKSCMNAQANMSTRPAIANTAIMIKSMPSVSTAASPSPGGRSNRCKAASARPPSEWSSLRPADVQSLKQRIARDAHGTVSVERVQPEARTPDCVRSHLQVPDTSTQGRLQPQ